MKRLPFGSAGVDNSILLPENDTEKEDLRQTLDDKGVCDSMAFNRSGINGCLRVSAPLEWAPDGSVEVSIQTPEPQQPIAAWFWVVEINDGRRFLWWSTEQGQLTAKSWA